VRGLGSALVLGLALLAAPAFAQGLVPGRPGPYVIDVRGVASGIPNQAPLFAPARDTIAVPSRGFGFDAGAHVYPLSLGPARIGIGANYTRARGSVTDPAVSAVITTLAPQLSFNFGTRSGWSYLSLGYGSLRMSSRVDESVVLAPALDTGSAPEADDSGLEAPQSTAAYTVDSGRRNSLNFGGGARWFLSRHIATSFDVRFHRVASGGTPSTPGFTVVGASVGLSIR
jgi:hypothetical protein